jgi:hypothetical protein
LVKEMGYTGRIASLEKEQLVVLESRMAIAGSPSAETPKPPRLQCEQNKSEMVTTMCVHRHGDATRSRSGTPAPSASKNVCCKHSLAGSPPCLCTAAGVVSFFISSSYIVVTDSLITARL